MTQKKSDTHSYPINESDEWRSTRIANAEPDLYDPNVPRLGRRESEPHSSEVTYLRDVLTTNFPVGRAFWDLHHYFIAEKGALKGKKIDLQLDISFFKELDIPHAMPSYDARKHDNNVPDLAINVLSKSTWRADFLDNAEACKDLSIPVYAVFSPYLVTSKRYAPPFFRVYFLQDDGSYKEEDLRSITLEEGGTINEAHLIDTSRVLPFRMGLMQLSQQYLGGKPLFRLILIDPSEPRIFPTLREKDLEEARKEIEDLKKRLARYQEKFGDLL